MAPIAYLNGEIVPQSQARLPVYDAGVVLGATVSEWLRTFRGKLFRLDDHLRRLFTSLELAHMKIELPPAEFAQICDRLIQQNGRLIEGDGELGLVIFVTAGDVASFQRMIDRPRRRAPTVCVHTFPLCFELYAAAMRDGVRLIVPSVRQIPAACWDPRIKCRSRMHYYLAEQEVHAIDPGATALLLDVDGNVTETSTANFLMVKDGAIVTPPRGSVLPGISQAVTTELACKLGIAVRERRIMLEDASNADEAFLASTPYCLAPVTHINGEPIGRDKPRWIYQQLLDAWDKHVGIDIREQICSVRQE